MPALLKTDWSGFVGAPGVTTMAIQNASVGDTPPTSAAVTAAAAAVRVFFDAIKAYLPSTVTLSWSGSCVFVDQTTGTLVSAVTYTPPATVTGTSVTAYSAPSGISVRWATTYTVNGRALRGRSFLVPAGGSAQQSDGSLATACQSTTLTAAQALVTSSTGASDWRLCVWHRPTGGAGGGAYPVSGASVKDQIAVLRSRRD